MTTISLLVATACTGVRVREFARESYEPPQRRPAASRVFSASRERVWSAVVGVLRSRGARFDELEPERGRLLAALPWASPAEAVASTDLGVVRKIITRTQRSYRSYSPLDYNCNACVVRNGTITAQSTELVEDLQIVLDPDRYRIEALLGAVVATVPSGVRLELSLDLIAMPPEPRGLEARSTGHLEKILLTAVEEVLARSPAQLR